MSAVLARVTANQVFLNRMMAVLPLKEIYRPGHSECQDASTDSRSTNDALEPETVTGPSPIS